MNRLTALESAHSVQNKCADTRREEDFPGQVEGPKGTRAGDLVNEESTADGCAKSRRDTRCRARACKLAFVDRISELLDASYRQVDNAVTDNRTNMRQWAFFANAQASSDGEAECENLDEKSAVAEEFGVVDSI